MISVSIIAYTNEICAKNILFLISASYIFTTVRYPQVIMRTKTKQNIGMFLSQESIMPRNIFSDNFLANIIYISKLVCEL